MAADPESRDRPGRRVRDLTEADRTVWAAYATTVRPLNGRAMPARSESLAAPPPEPPLSRPALPASPPVAARSTAPRPASLAIGESPGGVDHATWERLRGGKLAASRRLDLHGFTAQRAFHALLAFLRAAHTDRVRCVEVVTGRGQAEGSGVIRREFPLWLNLPEIRHLVLAAAYPHAANQGAVRLLLRRLR